MGRDCQLGQLCDLLIWRLMAWHMPLEKLLLLAGRGLKSPIPEIGSWKQWYCTSLKAEILLFSCPVGCSFRDKATVERLASLLHTQGLPAVLPTH